MPRRPEPTHRKSAATRGNFTRYSWALRVDAKSKCSGRFWRRGRRARAVGIETARLTMRAAALLALLVAFPASSRALDNGLGLRPPLGWRSYNAFGGTPTQAIMESTMDAMVDRSRNVSGVPTSLLDLGYKHVGLDGGWNYCFPENHTFHWASDGRPVRHGTHMVLAAAAAAACCRWHCAR
jgi:hypothetical protein